MDEKGEGKKKVMVAIDESECSHYALKWFLQNLGDTIETSNLLIFTARPVVDLGYLYASSYVVAPIELVRSVQENLASSDDEQEEGESSPTTSSL
ncbi:UNVERIFIED_CONTAM: hypothetical protein Sradi_0640400 [Sesamum radiatum]|uniref:UspA domain-containing protein n=1 Tax=Sesamum radiatum TaxID=300843 RepID=A0AAW2VKR5_SESRA